MNMQKIVEMIADMAEGPKNHVAPDVALRPDLVGMKLCDMPIVGVASADDEYFTTCGDPEVIGPHFMPPREWLPEARSVISIFFPFTSQIRKSNADRADWPSDEWLHARIEGQTFIQFVAESLRDELERSGFPSAVPSYSPRFTSTEKAQMTERLAGLSYTSVWSERHVAFACGLGTFGLARNLITEKGAAGRIGSVVTSLALPPTGRTYTEAYQYCNMCGACIRKCPVGTISFAEGKVHKPCADLLDAVREKHRPRYGCGKCQVGVPCQDRAPGA